MNSNDEMNIFEQASDSYTDLVFISKDDFRKIRFWFEPEKSLKTDGKLLIIKFIYLINRRGN